MPEREKMPDISPQSDDYIRRGEFTMLHGVVGGLREEMAVMRAAQSETKDDITSIKGGVATIQQEMKTMRGWRQLLLTGGIGIGWGLVQGVMHMMGWGSAQ